MNRRHAVRIGLASLLVGLPGCSGGEVSGPPELRLGRGECGECGMIVSEDRCSSALLVEVRGRREHVLFDDIGCMLDYERDRAGECTPVEAFVHDYASRAWVRAGEASFVFADRDALPTPMGSGIVAFADPGAAERLRAEVGGEVMGYGRLAAARREWMWARYGKPAGAP